MESMTLHDLKYKLSHALDEIELLEVLEITTEDIVTRFEDIILEKFDYLADELEEEKEEDEIQQH
jgi:hypothetical protein